jgi:hypothetical protein
MTGRRGRDRDGKRLLRLFVRTTDVRGVDRHEGSELLHSFRRSCPLREGLN